MNPQKATNNNLNLIRLLAALQVLTVHALNHFEVQSHFTLLPKITPGVPIFFFISGFLIYSSFERQSHHGARRFFVNRFLRIYPALWACFAVSLIAVACTGYFQETAITLRRFALWSLAQLTFAQPYNPAFMRGFGVGVLNGALWTIAVELQFYILTPLLFHLIRKLPSIIAAIILSSLALNLFFRMHLDWNNIYMKLAYTSCAPWLYMYLLGFGAAHYSQTSAAVAKVHFTYLVPLFVSSMMFIGKYEANASNAINPVSFALLAMLTLKLSTARLSLHPRISSFLQTSDISYGLYLYHMPTINVLVHLSRLSPWANITLAVTFSICASLASWHLVEKRALRHKRYPEAEGSLR